MFAHYRPPMPLQAIAPVALAPPKPGPCSRRLHHDLPLQRALNHIHRCGPRAFGHCIAELLDDVGAAPSALDAVLRWQQLDADLVAAFGDTDFAPAPLRLVPPDLGR
jgi:hypothetical protein